MKKIKSLFAWIGYEYNSILNHFLFKIWKKRADRLHEKTGYQFHVVPFNQNKLIIVSKSYSEPGICIGLKQFNKAIKNKGKQIDFIDILRIAYYSTSQKGLKR